MTRQNRLLPILGVCCLIAVPGSVRAALTLPSISSGSQPGDSVLDITYQHANNTKQSYNAQLDLLGGYALDSGMIQFELKAGSTPLAQGVTASYPEANALAGETQAPNGDGRLAITQLYYQNHNNAFNAGLLFPAAYLDTNNVANDEYHQFMGTTFVNDSTIEFPIYVLGGTYDQKIDSRMNVQFLLTSTRDLYGYNYTHLWGIHAADKGGFGATQFNWTVNQYLGNIGVWVNGNEQNVSLSTGKYSPNYGVYANIGGSMFNSIMNWDLRLGWATPQVSKAKNFISIQADKTVPLKVSGLYRSVTVGVGLSRTGVSKVPTTHLASMVQFEIYARTRLAGPVFVSPDIQWIDHSQFSPEAHGALVAGVRMGLAF